MTPSVLPAVSRASKPSYVLFGVLACVAALLFQVGSLLVAHRGDLRDMIRQRHRNGVERSEGFDGQFFLALAEDPALRPQTVASLDAPLIRARRIGFPLAARLLSPVTGGAASALLAALALSSGAAVWLLQVFAERNRLHPALVLSVPLMLPLVLSMELVTCELTASALLVAAFAAERWQTPALAAALLALACLTKEVAIVAIFACVISSARRRELARAGLYATAVAPLVLWHVYLVIRLGSRAAAGSLSANLSIPGVGLLGALVAAGAQLVGGANLAKAAGLVLALIWVVTGVLVSSRLVSSRLTPARVLASAGSLLALILSRGAPAYAYDEIFNFGRQLFILPVGLLLVYFMEYPDLSSRARTAVALWLVGGAALGAAWWSRKIWVLSQVALGM